MSEYNRKLLENLEKITRTTKENELYIEALGRIIERKDKELGQK